MLTLFTEYLNRLETLHQNIWNAIADLPPEALDWQPGLQMNSIAVLVMHSAGSERFWIGDVGMGEPSGRVREEEFRAKGMNAAQLKDRLDRSLAYARDAMGRITLDDLDTVRETGTAGERRSAAWALLHALEHVGIHLGHIQMTRQLWEAAQAQGGGLG